MHKSTHTTRTRTRITKSTEKCSRAEGHNNSSYQWKALPNQDNKYALCVDTLSNLFSEDHHEMFHRESNIGFQHLAKRKSLHQLLVK